MEHVNKPSPTAKAITALGIALLVSHFGTAAVAQEKKSGSGVIRLEETVIEGRVQKPTAFFITTRRLWSSS